MVELLIIVAVGYFIYHQFSKHDLPKSKKGSKRSTTHKAHKRRDKSTILDFPQKTASAVKTSVKSKKPQSTDYAHLSGIAQVKAADKTFAEKDFLKGAQAAYTYYYDAWNKKDDKTLTNFLGAKLLDDTIRTFNKLDEEQRTPHVEITDLDATIVDGRVVGRTALVDVKFTATQSENMLNAAGKTIEPKADAKKVTTIWTLARVIDSEDPNWSLEAINPLT